MKAGCLLAMLTSHCNIDSLPSLDLQRLISPGNFVVRYLRRTNFTGRTSPGELRQTCRNKSPAPARGSEPKSAHACNVPCDRRSSDRDSDPWPFTLEYQRRYGWEGKEQQIVPEALTLYYCNDRYTPAMPSLILGAENSALSYNAR